MYTFRIARALAKAYKKAGVSSDRMSMTVSTGDWPLSKVICTGWSRPLNEPRRLPSCSTRRRFTAKRASSNCPLSSRVITEESVSAS